MTDRPIRVGIAGLGTVGCGVIQLVHGQSRLRLGRRVEIAGVSARDRNRRRDVDISACRWFDDPCELAASGGIDVFCELIGGTDGVARASVETALRRRIGVVTANKALLAEHGADLASLAQECGASLRFEAAVCGGAPVVGPVRDILCAAEIVSLRGILNGTCNDILCRMDRDGLNYADSLAQAQECGYAEADSHLDVSGIDAAHKIALLASIAFAASCDFAQVGATGIERIRRIDITLARAFGYRIKLIASAVASSSGVGCLVEPTLLESDDPLYHVDGALNAVSITTRDAGCITISGPGAGRGPTALAVMADIAASGVPIAPFGLPVSALTRSFIRRQSDRSPRYLRAYLTDRPGALAMLTETLAVAGVSIDRMHQGEADHTGLRPVAMITHPCLAEAGAQAERLSAQLDVCAEPPLALSVGQV